MARKTGCGFVWGIVVSLYLVFIFLFSYIYPFTMDEYMFSFNNLSDSVMRWYYMYVFHNPRSGFLLSAVVLYFGKWAFLVANPFVQLGIVFGVFYLVELRLPDFKSCRDIPAFILITLLCVFAVAAPDNTLFWIVGAGNYSWTFLSFLFFMIALRRWAVGRDFIKDSGLWNFAVFVAAVILGMSNENNSPLAFMIFFLLGVYSVWKKKDLPKWYPAAFAGVILGMFLLWASPGLYARIVDTADTYGTQDFGEKFRLFCVNLYYFVDGNLYLSVFNTVMLLAFGITGGRKVFFNQNYVLGFLCAVFCGFLVLFLFPVPYSGMRTYYSASVFSIAAFVFLLKYLLEVYKINLLKYAALAVMIYSVVMFPFFAIPYFDMHRQEIERAAAISKAKTAGKKIVELPYFTIIKSYNYNTTITYNDVFFVKPQEMERYFGIRIQPIKILQDKPYKLHVYAVL